MLELIIILKAVFLGLIEGLTEFIPISSTAHLLLASSLINFNAIRNSLFEIVIQFGAILAVCFVYRQKLFDTALSLNKKNSQNFTINIALAFTPAIVFGVLFHDIIKEYFFSPVVIACAMISGGLIMIAADYFDSYKKKHHRATIDNIDHIKNSKALLIGLFQVIAMIPGVSRSGATIVGALFLGVSRKVATEFSFFLAIPTISAAAFYDLLKNISDLNSDGLELIFIGLISSFIFAFLVIKWFINYVAKHNFTLFAIYRILIGALILFLISSWATLQQKNQNMPFALDLAP